MAKPDRVNSNQLTLIRVKSNRPRLSFEHTMDTTQLKLRLPLDDIEFLDASAPPVVSRNQMATMLLHAAINTLRENPNAFKLQKKMLIEVGTPTETVTESRPEFNEPKTSYGAKRKK